MFDLFHLTHKHSGGDGALIDHGDLLGLTDDDHTQYVKHALATAASDFLVASGSGAFVKKTLAETLTILGITPYHCRVSNSTNISIPNANPSWNSLAFDTEQADQGGMHSTLTNTDRITFPEAGFFVFGGCVEFAANAAGIRYAGAHLNGASFLAVDSRPNTGASIPTVIAISGGYYFSANDYIKLLVYQNSGGALNVLTNTYTPVFWAAKVL